MSCLKMCTRLRFLCICMVITLPAAAAKRHADPRSRYLSAPAQLKEQSQMEYELWLRRVSNAGRTRFAPAKNIVGSSLVLTVDPVAGAADFTSIQEAIDSLPLYNMARVLVQLNRGLYTEKVHIPSTKAFVTIEGEGAEITIIQWNDTAGTIGPDGKPLGTYSSATFGVDSPYFIARNITFKNSAPVPAPGAKGSQGVALRISADTAAFYGCRFLGGQDTLYDQVGRHYFKDCYIEGSVDFVFGNGLSLYEGCVLHGVSSSMFGAMTAQKRESESDDTGFAFLRCSVTGSGAYYLGRAWGSFSRVVFAFSFMDSIVLPPGWDNCGHPSRETTVYYGQYKCTGPGASFAGRVAWARELNDEEAKPFLSLTFIDGGDWISQ